MDARWKRLGTRRAVNCCRSAERRVGEGRDGLVLWLKDDELGVVARTCRQQLDEEGAVAVAGVGGNSKRSGMVDSVSCGNLKGKTAVRIWRRKNLVGSNYRWRMGESEVELRMR